MEEMEGWAEGGDTYNSQLSRNNIHRSFSRLRSTHAPERTLSVNALACAPVQANARSFIRHHTCGCSLVFGCCFPPPTANNRRAHKYINSATNVCLLGEVVRDVFKAERFLLASCVCSMLPKQIGNPIVHTMGTMDIFPCTLSSHWQTYKLSEFKWCVWICVWLWAIWCQNQQTQIILVGVLCWSTGGGGAQDKIANVM